MNIKLVNYTPDPLGTIAWAKGLMRGVHKYPNEFTKEEKEKEFIDCTKTMLFGPLEFVSFQFDFIGVSRAFTHQMVRTRLASYVQESMRFSAKVGEQFKYLTPDTIMKDPTRMVPWTGKSRRQIYDDVMHKIQEGYADLINDKTPVEDARGVLPTNILTGIASSMSYSTIIHVCENRLCHQSQGEHRKAAETMKEEITKVEPLMGEFLGPSCLHSGVCGWESYLDRPCPLQKIYPMRSEVLKYSKEIKQFTAGRKLTG